jgi:hypothetical protein
MKSNLFFSSLIGLSLTAAASSVPTDFLGSPAKEGSRTVTIAPDTKVVNVTSGEAVTFISGDKTFSWNFDIAGRSASVPLNEVAPKGTFDHSVTVNVNEDHLLFP